MDGTLLEARASTPGASSARERAARALTSLRPFMAEDEARSARAFWTTWALVLAGGAAAALIEDLALRLVLALALGGLFARMFVIFHDSDHGAIFRRAPLKRFMMRAFTYAVLSPPSVWKAGHSEHHRETGLADGAIEGEYPVWSIDRYRRARPLERFAYRAARHPATICCGYLTAFALGSCILFVFKRSTHRWRAVVSLVLHVAIIAGLVAIGGWGAAIAAFIGPAAIAGALGAYLIYVQHNAPGVQYAMENRDPLEAATRATTFFRMGPIMNWFTANIGFHNAHHLSPRIPFYRLPAATAALLDALPDLRGRIVETSWSLKDIRDAFRANLYDPAARRMAPYAAVNVA